MPSLRKYLSLDDLWSTFGYLVLIVFARITNPTVEAPAASLLSSGMLAIFWLGSRNVRARNLDRNPNARVVFWASVAAVSLLASLRH